jgi:hypothetical protein
MKDRHLSPICPPAPKKLNNAIVYGICSNHPSLETIVGSPAPMMTPPMVKKTIVCPDAPNRPQNKSQIAIDDLW